MKEIRIGLIGTGFMGKAHAIAYRAAAGIFTGIPVPILRAVADVNTDAAQTAARQFGFERWDDDWQRLISDPSVDVVSITAPNMFHREMALAAIAAGKHVHCEKPIAPDAATAHEMMKAAEAAGIVTQVGYNYLKNPLLRQARDMIAAGELGDITGFRGIHAEDYMADPDASHSWRTDPRCGAGAVADLGSHIISIARFLLGPISGVGAMLETVVPTRPVAPGAQERRSVLVDDVARLNVRFARGCSGTIEANWVATGRKMHLSFEISGTRGALVFNQERLNELLFFRVSTPAREAGFVRIESGPAHPPYGQFCVAPGHQLGFNDLKTIEMAEFLAAIGGAERRGPDFHEAWEIQRVVDAAVESSKARTWREL